MPRTQYAPNEDFLSLYMRAAGELEVPSVWLEWAGISLIAACLNDRCCYYKHPDSPLYPNLYITLVGESGTGKDFAIKRASKFVKGLPAVHKFHGKLSGAGLADILNRPAARDASGMDRPTIWLTLPEISNSIGGGALADDFIKRITALYGGDDDDYEEVTRALIAEGRELNYGVPLLNCIFGSAQRWLLDCISPEAIESGAFGRILTVPSDFDTDIRITNPTLPPHYDEMMDELRWRVGRLTNLQGAFTMSPQAAAIRHRWYQTRPAPTDPRLLPSWRRADDNIFKLAMAFTASVATQPATAGSMEITAHAWNRARRYVAFAHNALPDLLQWASRKKSTSRIGEVADLLRAAGQIAHSALLKKVAHQDIDAKELRDYITTLIESREIALIRTPTGAKLYRWKGNP